MSVRPLVDLEKKPIGDVVLLRDVTQTSKEMARTLIWLVVFAAALIALAFWRCRWLLHQDEPVQGSLPL
jgi:hypothetical protein